MKYELHLKRVNPTALLYLTFTTIDKSTNAPGVVGFSYFPLFMNASDGMPAATEAVKKVAPHIGMYQMPIMYARPKEERPFGYERFVYLERVPTASVLVRVLKAPKDAQGKPVSTESLPPDQKHLSFIVAPEYKEGLYSTQYFSITEDERKIMTLRRRRANPPLLSVARDLAVDRGMDVSELQLDKLIDSSKKTPMLDLTYYSQYEAGLGVRVNIEALHDNKAKGFFGVLASVVPPGSYYDADRQGPPKDAFIFTEPDFSSHHQTPKFSEGDACILGFEPQQPGMCLFLDINLWLPDKGIFVDYGFAVAPLLETLETDADRTTLEYYVSSGVFSLPVYKGSPNPVIIQMLKESTEPMQVLRSALHDKTIQQLGTTSVIVRVVDTQRKMHFLKSFEQQPPSTKYLEKGQLSTHTYKPLGGGLFGGPTKLRELVPSKYKGKEAAYATFLEKEFKAFLKI